MSVTLRFGGADALDSARRLFAMLHRVSGPGGSRRATTCAVPLTEHDAAEPNDGGRAADVGRHPLHTPRSERYLTSRSSTLGARTECPGRGRRDPLHSRRSARGRTPSRRALIRRSAPDRGRIWTRSIGLGRAIPAAISLRGLARLRDEAPRLGDPCPPRHHPPTVRVGIGRPWLTAHLLTTPNAGGGAITRRKEPHFLTLRNNVSRAGSLG